MPDKVVKRVRVRVVGRVHGVYFRASTQERARALGLSGWVRNTADGAVEMEVQGAPLAIEGLVAWCREGPPAAQVASVRVEELAGVAQAEEDFVIRR
jgi:acylphosphatase